MSNNKQSSVDFLIKQKAKYGMIINDDLRIAKAMHKEETLKLYYAYEDYVLREEGIIKTFGQFYNETFGE